MALSTPAAPVRDIALTVPCVISALPPPFVVDEGSLSAATVEVAPPVDVLPELETAVEESHKLEEEWRRQSVLGRLGQAIEPVVQPLGVYLVPLMVGTRRNSL